MLRESVYTHIKLFDKQIIFFLRRGNPSKTPASRKEGIWSSMGFLPKPERT